MGFSAYTKKQLNIFSIGGGGAIENLTCEIDKTASRDTFSREAQGPIIPWTLMSLEQFISNIPLHKEDKIRLSTNQLLPQLIDLIMFS